MTRTHLLPVLLAALTISACGESPVAPTAVAGDALSLERTGTTRDGARQSPLLRRLLDQALARVRRARGEEGVRRATVAVRAQVDSAAAARRAGDLERAEIHAARAQLETARVVVRVLGPRTVVRVTEELRAALRRVTERLSAAESNGSDVSAARATVERASARLRESKAAMEAREPARALVLAARAADLLASVR